MFAPLKRVAQLADDGIKIRVAQVFSLEKAVKAFELVETGRPHGKGRFRNWIVSATCATTPGPHVPHS